MAPIGAKKWQCTYIGMYICKYTITNLNWPVLICQGVLSWSSNKENCAMQEWIRRGI